MILFCLLCMAGASLARPQVESVTDLESLQEDFTTDSPILETADTKVEDFLLVNEDLAVTPANTTPDDIEEEDTTEINGEIIDNIIIDVKPSVVIKEEKKISLEISSYPDSSVVFRRSSGPLGLSCDARSEVDQDIKFMWTKNGRFLDSSSGRVTFESQTNGNIMIFNPDSQDEGLYQCVVSNSEGVVFSPVVKVKMISVKPRSRSRAKSARGLKSDEVAVYLPVNNNGKFGEEQDVFLVLPASVTSELEEE